MWFFTNVLCKQLDQLEAYCAYCGNLMRATQVLQQQRKAHPSLAEYLKVILVCITKYETDI
jgi:thymidine kinase